MPKDIPLIFDLIDERHEIIELEDGCMYVNSVIASQHSNLSALAKRKIAPLDPERISIMGRTLPELSRELRKFKTLVVHLAYFDEGFTEFWINSQEFNLRLKTAYDFILRTVPGAIALEIPQYLCRAARGNPWGYAPMHYVVDYYLRFLYEFERKMNYGLLITPWPKIPTS